MRNSTTWVYLHTAVTADCTIIGTPCAEPLDSPIYWKVPITAVLHTLLLDSISHQNLCTGSDQSQLLESSNYRAVTMGCSQDTVETSGKFFCWLCCFVPLLCLILGWTCGVVGGWTDLWLRMMDWWGDLLEKEQEASLWLIKWLLELWYSILCMEKIGEKEEQEDLWQRLIPITGKFQLSCSHYGLLTGYSRNKWEILLLALLLRPLALFDFGLDMWSGGWLDWFMIEDDGLVRRSTREGAGSFFVID